MLDMRVYLAIFQQDSLVSAGKLFEKGLTLGTGQCNVKVRFFLHLALIIILDASHSDVQPLSARFDHRR